MQQQNSSLQCGVFPRCPGAMASMDLPQLRECTEPLATHGAFAAAVSVAPFRPSGVLDEEEEKGRTDALAAAVAARAA